MESLHEGMEEASGSRLFEAQKVIAGEYRELLAGITKSSVLERGYDH